MWDDETIILLDKMTKEVKELKAEVNTAHQAIRNNEQIVAQVIEALRKRYGNCLLDEPVLPGELPFDRVNIMETTNQLRILEEAPPMPEAISIPCNQEMASSIAKAKNGKKESVTADAT